MLLNRGKGGVIIKTSNSGKYFGPSRDSFFEQEGESRVLQTLGPHRSLTCSKWYTDYGGSPKLGSRRIAVSLYASVLFWWEKGQLAVHIRRQW